MTNRIQILVRFINGYATSLEVESTDTLGTVKEKMQDKVGIPKGKQKIIFGGTMLMEDDRTLSEYNIKNSDTVHMVLHIRCRGHCGCRGQSAEYKITPTLKIVAKTLTGKSITLDVEPTETIEDMKKKIQIKEGIPPENQKITFAGKVLPDDRILFLYKMQFYSLLVLLGSFPMKIFAMMPFGDTIALAVRSIETIKDVKKKIQIETELIAEEQKITFAGKVLQDDRTLFYHNIQTQSLLRVHVVRMFPMKLFVKTLAGEIIALDVNSNETINDVKKKVELVEGIPSEQQVLTFLRQELKDTLTLYELDIENEYRISLLKRP